MQNMDTLLRCPICFDFLSITMMSQCSHNCKYAWGMPHLSSARLCSLWYLCLSLSISKLYNFSHTMLLHDDVQYTMWRLTSGLYSRWYFWPEVTEAQTSILCLFLDLPPQGSFCLPLLLGAHCCKYINIQYYCINWIELNHFFFFKQFAPSAYESFFLTSCSALFVIW